MYTAITLLACHIWPNDRQQSVWYVELLSLSGAMAAIETT
jgi:hypothetical protein